MVKRGNDIRGCLRLFDGDVVRPLPMALVVMLHIGSGQRAVAGQCRQLVQQLLIQPCVAHPLGIGLVGCFSPQVGDSAPYHPQQMIGADYQTIAQKAGYLDCARRLDDPGRHRRA
jgi:hypothetical protein